MPGIATMLATEHTLTLMQLYGLVLLRMALLVPHPLALLDTIGHLLKPDRSIFNKN